MQGRELLCSYQPTLLVRHKVYPAYTQVFAGTSKQKFPGVLADDSGPVRVFESHIVGSIRCSRCCCKAGYSCAIVVAVMEQKGHYLHILAELQLVDWFCSVKLAATAVYAACSCQTGVYGEGP